MDPVDSCPLTSLLTRCGVLYGVSGDDKINALMAVVARLELPEGVNRDLVIEELLRREDISSTGIGQGIALPHPQNAAALHMPASLVALAFLAHPIEYGAPDELPVQAIFVILSNDRAQHLRLLALLGRVLQQADVMDALARQLPAAELLAVIHRVEERMQNKLAAGKVPPR
jgi:PTS system nitrogen regulatory IIA component